MKSPRIANAIAYLDDELICEAASSEAVKKPMRFKWLPLAACFTLVLLAAIRIIPMIPSADPLSPPVSDNSGDSQAPHETVKPEKEKYYDYSINSSTFSTYVLGQIISEDRIGNKIEDITVITGWKSEDGEWLSSETLSAEVYVIENVDSDVVVALKFTDADGTVDTTQYYAIMHPNAEYNGMPFPDYSKENPVRYLEESDMGKCNGWQDFGLSGEIRTITVPVGSTFIYQMYSYYIRNDLSHIYAKEELPDALENLPEWLTDTVTAGRRSFWYSMSNRVPHHISLESITTLPSEDGTMTFVKAEYKIQLTDSFGEKEENWVIYFMEEDGVYSAYAVVANQNYDFVKSYTESIVKSYQKKQ